MTELALLDDHAAITAPDTVRIQRLLPGPIDRVWSFITEGDLRRRWLAAGAMDQRPGATFALTWRNDELTDPPGERPEGMAEEHTATCTILEVSPPHLLRYDWPEVGEVTITLEPKGADVLLILTHARALNARTMRGVSAGWHAHLDILRAVLRDETPTPFWDSFRALRAAYETRLG